MVIFWMKSLIDSAQAPDARTASTHTMPAASLMTFSTAFDPLACISARSGSPDRMSPVQNAIPSRGVGKAAAKRSMDVMDRHIKESDWKLFSRLAPLALDRL